MGRGARRRALYSWWCLKEELRKRASAWRVEEKSPAVPALMEAARARGVDLAALVNRMRVIYPRLSEGQLARIAALDESIAREVRLECSFVGAVWAEIANGGPEGLRCRAYFAVDGTEVSAVELAGDFRTGWSSVDDELAVRGSRM